MPFKGANTIVIHTTDSSKQALEKLGRLLVQQGYTMDKFDLILAYLATKPKSVGQLTPAAYTYTSVAMPEATGTALHIRGEYTVPLGMRTMTESMFWVKGDMLHAKQCFTAVHAVATAYGGRMGYMLKP